MARGLGKGGRDMIGLLLRHVRNDLRQHKGVAVALVTVLVLSGFLMAGGAIVIERLAGSMDRLFATAKPPHYLQMHQGDYDLGALESFATARPEIAAWQVVDMLGYDGSAISWQRPGTTERGDLAESLIDNLILTQNEHFDFLLDSVDEHVVQPTSGEIYVPIAYREQFGLRLGDILTISTGSGHQPFEIAGFVRDAQMASSMSSATRLVVSPADFERLRSSGGASPEISVEYRLTDPGAVAALDQAYQSDSRLPHQGQAVTAVMIRTITMISDGLVAAGFIFASLVLIAIAMLNVRFVIRSTLADEIHQIGAMRAIGLPGGSITGLYLVRYGVTAFLGCLIGGALAQLARPALTTSLRTNFGDAPATVLTVLAPVASVAVVWLLVVGMCWRTVRAAGRVPVIAALVHGRARWPRRPRLLRRRGSQLSGVRGRRVALRLALLELRAEHRQWALVPVVFALVAFVVTVPANVLATFENPRFLSYLGTPPSDVRVDIGFTGSAASADQVSDAMVTELTADRRVASVTTEAQVRYEARGADGWEPIRVDLGDAAGVGLAFSSGRSPQPGELALSSLNAEKYGVTVGDRVPIRGPGVSDAVVISGIYQDVTSGGYTAKLRAVSPATADRWTIHVELAPGVDPTAFAEEYDADFPTAAVIPLQRYAQQTLAHTTDALRVSAIAATGIGVLTAALISTVFLQLQLARYRPRMGILSAIGFSAPMINSQLWIKLGLTVTIGILAGLGCAAIAGEPLVSALLSAAGIGLSQLSLIANPWLAWIGQPLMLLGAGLGGVAVLLHRLRHADRSQWLR